MARPAASRRRSARSGPHPWAPLALIGGLLVVMYAAMFGTGHTSPKLGLDLQGGTSVILTPRVVGGGSPNSGSIDKAVDIIRERVDGLGVAESEVVKQGNTIVINVPGKNRDDVVNLVGTTAQLRFREVLDVAPPQSSVPESTTPTPAPTPDASPDASPGVTPTPATESGSPAAAPAAAAGSGLVAMPAGMPAALLVDPTTADPATAADTPAVSPSAPELGPAVPSAPATEAPSEAPSAEPTPDTSTSGSTTPTIDPALQQKFNELDCTQPENRAGNVVDDPAVQIIACDRKGTAKYLLAPARVLGTDVKSAVATLDTNAQGFSTGHWQVNLSFTGSGQSKWTQLTQDTVGQQVAVVLDGVVQSAPQIQGVINGDASITGDFTQKEAQDLANVLKYGALPLAFDKSQAESISPTLGRDSLHAGLLAGAIGLGLVVIYSFFYYRALGVVTVLSLVVSALLIYACVCLLGPVMGFTLSLAGIAGVIVSIGITADSFVVYFERIKDEVRDGRSVRSAVERGWTRARRTIVTADVVSILAAVALYWLSIGAVRGFAFTLGLSTLLDLVVVFLFTKPLVSILTRSHFFSGGRLSGLRSKAPLRSGRVNGPVPDGPSPEDVPPDGAGVAGSGRPGRGGRRSSGLGAAGKGRA